MRVLFVHTSYKFRGGEDTVVEEEINLLRSHAVTVDLLAFSNAGDVAASLLQLPFNFRSYKKTIRKVNEFKPDVVHIHNLHFAGSASVIYAIKKCNVPFVMTLHNYRLLCPSATLFYNGAIFTNSLKHTFPWKAVKLGVYKNSKLVTFWSALSVYMHKISGTWKQCAKLIVLQKHSKKLFLKSSLGFTIDQVVVKANFCSPFLKKAKHEGNYFLYVGRLSNEKGIDILLKAFSTSNLSLVIAGDGPLKDHVATAVQHHSNIQYVGKLGKEAISDLMAQSSALIFPSVWFEGMPLTIIEAFACGTPVIASNIGAMQTMITNNYNGLHFKAGDADDLLNTIMYWQTLPAEQKNEFSTNASITYNENYTPDLNFIIISRIYASAMQHKGNESYHLL
ncbi:MAG: glycosyltransferase [Chitinophagaceae bacterium]|nr:glycosyltransferase [Chitinophagaceae bacterium]